MSQEIPEGHKQIRRLPLWPTLRTACQFPWRHRRQVGRLLVIPVSLSIIVTVLILYWGEREDSWGKVLSYALDFLYAPIFTFFAVSYHRLILIGEKAVSRYGVPGWTMRETRFFLWFIAMYLIAAAFMVFLMAAAGVLTIIIGWAMMIATSVVPELPTFEYIAPIVSLVLLAYFIGRISLILPAIAVDLRPNFKWAMSLSEGNGWRLALLVGGTPIVFWGLYRLVLQSLGVLSDMPPEETSLKLDTLWVAINGLQQLVYYAWLTIEVAILSFSYRFLSQNMESTTSIQELA